MPNPASRWIRAAAVLIAFYQSVVFLTKGVPLLYSALTAPGHGMEPGAKAYAEALVGMVIRLAIWLFATRWLYKRSEHIGTLIDG